MFNYCVCCLFISGLRRFFLNWRFWIIKLVNEQELLLLHWAQPSLCFWLLMRLLRWNSTFVLLTSTLFVEPFWSGYFWYLVNVMVHVMHSVIDKKLFSGNFFPQSPSAYGWVKHKSCFEKIILAEYFGGLGWVVLGANFLPHEIKWRFWLLNSSGTLFYGGSISKILLIRY